MEDAIKIGDVVAIAHPNICRVGGYDVVVSDEPHFVAINGKKVTSGLTSFVRI